MKQIGTPPGAFKFRLIAIVILMLIFILVFLSYSNALSIATEKASIQQSKSIINSILAVVFATYTVRGELGRLNDLSGGNPFVYLEKYNMLPSTYRGEIKGEILQDAISGWYYDEEKGLVIYKPFHEKKMYYFTIELDFQDVNGSGYYEAESDQFNRLSFRQIPQQRGDTAVEIP